ncbi:MAG: DUF2231 domain-containing protein [Candidatus Marinimicrobia bacterium]|nr:DUF2231 domain-containing protein [Candidatus Neomarinimicrobiota bacterium]MBT7424092.1 DUF2231 domain-containing protein [Candidatus Neomarinimicrobiota bacterium]
MMYDLHPLVIHFPIALFSAAILFDLLFLIFNNNDFYVGGWWTMLFALVASAAAIATGIIDDTLIGHLGSVYPLWLNHGLVQLFSCILFLTLFLWRTKDKSIFYDNLKKRVYTATALIGIVILYYGGHLGAELAGRV